MKKHYLCFAVLMACILTGCGAGNAQTTENDTTIVEDETSDLLQTEEHVSEEAPESESSTFKALEIIDSGWFLKDKEWVYYYVNLHNPNDEIAVEFPTFRITARDENGILLGTEDQTLSILYPGQDFVYGFQAFSVDEKPDSVEFEVLAP